MAQIEDLTKRNPYSGWPMFVFWAFMMVFTFHACTHMVAAGDTWVALACGRHFVNHGVDTVEPFSANSHKAGPTEETIKKWPGWARALAKPFDIETIRKWHPTGWINQNWLTHVVFYKLVTIFGSEDEYNYNALIYWKFAIYIINVIAVYYLTRVLGASVPLSATAAAMALFVGRTFLDVRPAGYANMLVPVFLLILALAIYKNIRYIWLIVPVTVFWSNCHGGYIYVFIMLVPFLGLHLFSMILPKDWFVSIEFKDWLQIVYASIATFIAMVLFNPFHLTNLTHTFEISISKHAESWRNVNEWHRAFEWTNPVGVSFPFLAFYVSGVTVLILWLVSRMFKPLPSNAPMRQLKAQEVKYWFLSPTFGFTGAICTCVTFYIWFSLIDNDPLNIFLAAWFVGILALSAFWNIHFIYVIAFLALFAIELSDATTGYSGRYIYPFIILPTFLIIHLFAPCFPNKPKLTKLKIALVAGTTIASVILVLGIADPFKAGSFSKAIGMLPELKRIWHPLAEGKMQFNYSGLFIVLYILNFFSLAILLLWDNIKQFFTVTATSDNREEIPLTWPRIDLPILAVAALTVYMAIKSRRFIPIAASAGCPVMALMIDQTIKVVSARMRYNKTQNFALAPLGMPVRNTVISVTALVTVVFGIIWGAKYKRIYLDPWPSDTKRTSVFMRMTASNIKPFEAGQFIKDNKLSGNMYNYWTEGGAIAFFQEPDPETGFTPLKLFMDGRAQAAYNHDKFELWKDIKAGGEELMLNLLRERKGTSSDLKLTYEDYQEIGKNIEEMLDKYDVWIVLMPSSEVPYPLMGIKEVNRNSSFVFMKGLQTRTNWIEVYMDNDQHLMVNTNTQKGKDLADKVMNNKAVFPTEFSRHITLANIYLRYKDPKLASMGFDHAKKAFELEKNQASTLKLAIEAQRHAHLKAEAMKVLQEYLEDFMKNIDMYSKEAGYAHKLLAAVTSARNLESYYKYTDEKLASRYKEFLSEYEKIPRQISYDTKW